MEVDQHGNTKYSDVPSSTSQTVDLNDKSAGISTINSTQSEKLVQEAIKKDNTAKEAVVDEKNPKEVNPVGETAVVMDAVKKEKMPYSVFQMTTPIDQQTFQNERSIPVDFKVDPALQEGDLIQVFVDGNAVGSPVHATHVEVAGLNRGSHQFHGVLINDKKSILKQTPPITIFIHYANANSRPN